MAACVFCGSTTNKITKEHIFAQWIGRMYPGLGRGSAEIIRADQSITAFPQSVLNQEVYAPCQRCNSGWMSAIESLAKPILGPMILTGAATDLTPANQELLATWAVKTALMLEHIHPADRVIPDTEYHRFYAAKRPPDGYAVWIAFRQGFADSAGRELLVGARHQSVRATSTDAPDSTDVVRRLIKQGGFAYGVTFAVGHIAFRIFAHNLPGRFNFDWDDRVMQWVWPVQPRVAWPGSVSIDTIGGIDGLHKVFTDIPPPTSSTTWKRG